MTRVGINHFLMPIGFVEWELKNERTGQITKSGKANIVVNYARERLARSVIGESITYPGFVAVGTGTNTPAAADTALQTLSQYDGSNDAKAVSSKSLKSLYTSRFVAQFNSAQANITIKELGLFDAANAGNMWARVSVDITKTSSEVLNVYWNITFDRSSGVAIKTGASINGTGTAVDGTAFTVSFASTVTVVMIHNNSGQKMYYKINEDLDAASPPVDYDFILADGESLLLTNEEIAITDIDVFGSGISAGALPKNQYGFVGW